MSPLKILLVEDDELFRLGLQFRLQQEPDIEIIAQAADGETAVELANRHPLLLTNREREILTLIIAGKLDRDIAETLYIAPATVRVHVHAMLNKLGARDRSQAISIAKQQQLLD